jgi:hypothetical protein
MLNNLYRQPPRKPRKNNRQPKRANRTRGGCPYLTDDPRTAQWYRQQTRLHAFDRWLHTPEVDDDYTPYSRVVAAEIGS